MAIPNVEVMVVLNVFLEEDADSICPFVSRENEKKSSLPHSLRNGKNSLPSSENCIDLIILQPF